MFIDLPLEFNLLGYKCKQFIENNILQIKFMKSDSVSLNKLPYNLKILIYLSFGIQMIKVIIVLTQYKNGVKFRLLLDIFTTFV